MLSESLLHVLLSFSVYEVSLQRQSEVRALVAYCLQLSFVGLHELEPLVVWQECCAEQLEENVRLLCVHNFPFHNRRNVMQKLWEETCDYKHAVGALRIAAVML